MRVPQGDGMSEPISGEELAEFRTMFSRKVSPTLNRFMDEIERQRAEIERLNRVVYVSLEAAKVLKKRLDHLRNGLTWQAKDELYASSDDLNQLLDGTLDPAQQSDDLGELARLRAALKELEELYEQNCGCLPSHG